MNTLTLQDLRGPLFTSQALAHRKYVLPGVVALHALAGAALLSLHTPPKPVEPDQLINIQWVPTTEQPTPQTPQPVKRETPHQKTDAPVTPAPQTPQPVTAPAVIHSEAPTPAPVEAPKLVAQTPPPPAAATPAPAVVTPPQPAEQPFNQQVDCVQSPKPPYPQRELDDGHQGTTLLRMVVDEAGYPQSVEIISGSGYTQLDRAARSWVAQKWQCPMRAGNKKLRAGFQIPIVWTL